MGLQVQAFQLAQGGHLQGHGSCHFSVLVFPILGSEKSPLPILPLLAASPYPWLAITANLALIIGSDCRALARSSQLLVNLCLYYLWSSLGTTLPTAVFPHLTMATDFFLFYSIAYLLNRVIFTLCFYFVTYLSFINSGNLTFVMHFAELLPANLSLSNLMVFPQSPLHSVFPLHLALQTASFFLDILYSLFPRALQSLVLLWSFWCTFLFM